MTRDEIEAMCEWRASGGVLSHAEIDRVFAALADLSWVRDNFARQERQRGDDVLVAREIERERCAQIAEAYNSPYCDRIAAAIRIVRN